MPEHQQHAPPEDPAPSLPQPQPDLVGATLVAVAPDKYRTGNHRALWNHLGGISYTVMDVAEMLSTHYDSDAHFTTGVVHAGGEAPVYQPRLTKTPERIASALLVDPLGELRAHGFDVQHHLLVADVDGPGHTPLTPKQFEDARSRLASVPNIGWYTSRAGLRILQPLSRPIPPEHLEAILPGWLSQLACLMGPRWSVDYKCVDWTRQFRCPSVIRDGERSTPFVDVSGMTTIDPPPKPVSLTRAMPAEGRAPQAALARRSEHMERARKYVGAIPVPRCGQSQCDATLWSVALHVVRGFSLDDTSAYDVVASWAARSSHGWGEGDLRRKIADASKAAVADGFHLVDGRRDAGSLDGGVGLGVEEVGGDGDARGGGSGSGRDDSNGSANAWADAAEAGAGIHDEPPAELVRIFRLTDLGNAERLVDRHGRDIRYCEPWGKWLVWSGRRWEVDRELHVERLAQETVRSIYREASRETDSQRRQALVDHARRSESNGRRVAMMEQARSLPGVPILPEQLDREPWLLNVHNGTLDLRSGILLEHRRDNYLTKMAGVSYEPDATCPQYEAFLARVLPDETVRRLVWQLDAYALTGVVHEHVFPIHYGAGRNGKGVHKDTILHLFADYGRQVPTELLMAKRGEAHPTEKTTLFGIRLAMAVETEEGRSLNVAFVKQATGGDRISARRMREDFWEFDPTHKLQLSTNHMPVIRETKDAVWERVLLIPWTVMIPETERDVRLVDKLRAEGPGILRRLLEHCLAWQREGLRIPAAVRAATRAYRSEMDVLGKFIDDCCVVDAGAVEGATPLFKTFERWAEDNKERGMSQTKFGTALGERGFAKGRDGEGRTTYSGLRLRADRPSGASTPPSGNGMSSDEISDQELEYLVTRTSAEGSEGSEGFSRIAARGALPHTANGTVTSNSSGSSTPPTSAGISHSTVERSERLATVGPPLCACAEGSEGPGGIQERSSDERRDDDQRRAGEEDLIDMV